jgi:Integrase core domain
MKNKSDVLICFKHFYKAVQTQYGTMMKALRSDNGTKYTNKAFDEYLSTHKIHHRTTCPYTSAK